MDKSSLWIEFSDTNGDVGSARWGEPLTDAQIDEAIAAITNIIGREPDTLS